MSPEIYIRNPRKASIYARGPSLHLPRLHLAEDRREEPDFGGAAAKTTWVRPRGPIGGHPHMPLAKARPAATGSDLTTAGSMARSGGAAVGG